MRDCADTGMRDSLPELMHGRLEGELGQAVRVHVEECAACRAELALLQQVRELATGGGPVVDVTRISASLPPYRRAPIWRRVPASPALAAAAVVLAVGGAWTAMRVLDERDERPGGAVGAGRSAQTAELAVGGGMLGDLTESELRTLLVELGTIEAVPSPEPEVVPPALTRSGT